MIDDLQELVKLLHADLIERSEERKDVAASLRALHAGRQKQQRSAQSYEEWREEFLTQVAAAWVLACVFVRYLEDNRFLRDFHLAGPDADALAQARENFNAFMRHHPDDAERNYLLAVFRRMQTVHAVKDLFAPGKTALWAVEPSNAAAMKLLEFWHEIDAESGELKRCFSPRRQDRKEPAELSSLANFASLRETLEVPPKYRKEDFQKDALGKDGLWRLRGELDVPRERWIGYPPLAGRQGDEEPSPVVTWAGYNHLDQALALAKYFDDRKDRDTGSKDWMLPLLAGLEQVLPWLLQWHNEPDPAYEGQRMGDYFRDVVLPDALQTQGLTIEQCRAWRPAAPPKKPRQRKRRG